MMRRRYDWKHLTNLSGCLLLLGCQGVSRPVRIGSAASPPSKIVLDQPGSGSTGGRIPDQIVERDQAVTAHGILQKDEKAIARVGWQEQPPLLPIPEELGESELLTLDELQQLAMSGNPTLSQAWALVQQSQGNWLQSGLYPNPVVGYNGTGNNGAFDAQGGFISQNIVTANKLSLNRAVASHDVQRAQWEAEAQRLRVMNEIRIRYVAALGAQRQVAVAEDLVKVADEGVRLSEQLMEGEQVSRADVLQARLQRNQTGLILRNAQFRVDSTWKQLGNVTGWPHLPLRRLEGTLDEEIPELDWDFAWQRLSTENPLLQAARARAASAAIQVRREEVQPIPDLQVMGNVWNDQIRPPSMMYGLNIGITLPIFDHNQGNVAAAVGDLHASRAEVTRLELALRDSLAEAYQRYQAAKNQAQTYRDSILPTAQDNLTLTLKAYEEGELDFLRVLTARRDLFEANIAYVTALTDLRISVIEIEGLQLTGGLDPIDSRPSPANQSGQTNGAGA